jgi:hypothetical protein
MTPTRVSALLAASLLLAALASARTAAPTLESIDVLYGTIGTPFQLTGSGFVSKPQVWLSFPGEKKKYMAKVLSFTDSTIDAAIGNYIDAGTLDVFAKVGKETATLPGAFTAERPEFDGVSPASAPPGAEVALKGSYFGTLKGTVSVKGKNAKITSWNDSEAHFIVPNVSHGPTSTTLGNKVGNFTITGIFGVQPVVPKPSGPDLAELLMAASSGGWQGYTVAAANLQNAYDGAKHVATIEGDLDTAGRHFQLKFPFDLGADATPKTFTNDPSTSMEITIPLGGTTVWSSSQPGSSWTVLVAKKTGNASKGYHLTGLVHGSIERESGTANPALLPFTLAWRATLEP